MRLSNIYEDFNQNSDALLDRSRAEELSGDSAEAATRAEKQFKAQRKASDKQSDKATKQRRKTALSQLSTMRWDPSNKKFQSLAAQLIGKPDG